MNYTKKYNLLNEIDETGDAQKIYDLYVAFEMIQGCNKIHISDFAVALITGIGIKRVIAAKILLQYFGYIKYNDEEKQKIIKQENIVTDASMIEVIKCWEKK